MIRPLAHLLETWDLGRMIVVVRTDRRRLLMVGFGARMARELSQNASESVE